MLELIVVVTVPVDAGREHCELYTAEEPKTNYLKLGRNRRCILSMVTRKGHESQLRLQATTPNFVWIDVPIFEPDWADVVLTSCWRSEFRDVATRWFAQCCFLDKKLHKPLTSHPSLAPDLVECATLLSKTHNGRGSEHIQIALSKKF